MPEADLPVDRPPLAAIVGAAMQQRVTRGAEPLAVDNWCGRGDAYDAAHAGGLG
jgi:hypothetical protein